MNATCPACETVYRVDPAKVPEGGVRARCSHCGGVFAVGAPAAKAAAGEEPQTEPSPAARPAASAPSFGSTDPHAKARRLARALISDIVVYNPDRLARSASDGTLRREFREEIQKSWEEYVAQVGDKFGRETPYFREALNEVLAGGQRAF